MSTSMVSTVLEIEREAESVLKKAEQDVEKILSTARQQREETTQAAEASVKKEIADLEVRAAADRGKKVKELAAAGETALAAVRNISDAAFNGGVQHIMKALAGK